MSDDGAPDARAELDRLLDDFSRGILPSIGFVRSVKQLRDAHPGLIAPRPSLGVAVVAGFGHHTSGRDLMSLLLEIEGFTVRNTQVGEMDSDVIGMCMQPDVTVLCLSAQATEGVNGIADIIRELDETEARGRIVFNAGGCPLSETTARSLGCDVYAQSAVESARAIKAEVESRHSAANP